MVERYDMQARLHRITAPTLILTGERDLLVSPQSLATLAEGVAGAKAVSLRGCGHLAFVTRPECVAQEVRQFILEA
jgi:pimeloyl-ACP methyl ester carboxylesterase